MLDRYFVLCRIDFFRIVSNTPILLLFIRLIQIFNKPLGITIEQ